MNTPHPPPTPYFKGLPNTLTPACINIPKIPSEGFPRPSEHQPLMHEIPKTPYSSTPLIQLHVWIWWSQGHPEDTPPILPLLPHPTPTHQSPGVGGRRPRAAGSPH